MKRERDFVQLLDEAKKLSVGERSIGVNVIGSDSMMVDPIQRPLSQLVQKSKSLLLSQKTQLQAPAVKGALLLSRDGFDSDKHAKTLESLALKTKSEEFQPIDTDIDEYLRRQHDQIVASVLEDVQNATINHFEDQFLGEMKKDWEKTKVEVLRERRKLSSFSNKIQQHQFDHHSQYEQQQQQPSQQQQQQQIQFPQNSTNSNSKLSAGALTRFTHYLQVLKQFQKSRGKPFPLFTNFSRFPSTSSAASQKEHDEIRCCWEILVMQVGEDEQKPTSIPPENHFKDFSSSDSSQRSLIRSSIQFLQSQFKRILKEKVKEKATNGTGNVGVSGSASFSVIVDHFLRIRLTTDPAHKSWRPNLIVYDEIPVWGKVYYLMRCGELAQCQTFASKFSHLKSLSRFLPIFISRQNGGDDELGSENEKFVESQMEKASDPYEKVVWSLIGRLPLAQSHLSDIVQTTQDYLWLKLNILPSNHSHQPHHSISLEKIQRKVLESESQFSSKQSNQLLFLHSLLLTLQYQKALELIVRSDLLMDGLHLAIALYYYGFVREESIELGRMLKYGATMLWVSGEMEMSDCLYYLTVLRDSTQSLSEFLLEDVNTLIPSLEKIVGPERSSSIIQHSALAAQHSGRLDLAISLFAYTKNYERLLGVMMYSLGGEMEVERLRQLESLADSLLLKLDNSQPKQLIAAFERMTAIIHFFHLYAQLKQSSVIQPLDSSLYWNALRLVQMMQKMALLPLEVPVSPQSELSGVNTINRNDQQLRAQSHLALIQQKLENFTSLDPSIQRLFPELLTGTMEALKILHQSILSEPMAAAQSRRDQLEWISTVSQNLLLLAGTVEVRIPRHTYNRLSSLQTQMSTAWSR